MADNNIPAIITVSRQLGSGGSFLGQKLAARLGLTFVDRQIIIEAARKLKLLEKEVESRGEKISTFFETLLASLINYPTAMYYAPPEMHLPSDKDIFKAQCEIIEEIVRKQPSVIIGRGSSHILKDHPRHLSVFVHAGKAFRIKRVSNIYGMSGEEAKKTVRECDRNRAEYNKTLSGQEWLDVRRYHMGIDTGVLGFEQAEELIVSCAENKLGIGMGQHD